MIALLLSLIATMSGAGSHAAAQISPAPASAVSSKSVLKPLTGHPLAG